MARTPARGTATVLLPLSEANHEPGGQTIAGVVRLLHAIIRPLTKRDWRDQEKLPQTGGLVVVANHISNVDPFSLGQFIAFSGRWPRFLGKASVFKVPVVGAILKAAGQIPVVFTPSCVSLSFATWGRPVFRSTPVDQFTCSKGVAEITWPV